MADPNNNPVPDDIQQLIQERQGNVVPSDIQQLIQERTGGQQAAQGNGSPVPPDIQQLVAERLGQPMPAAVPQQQQPQPKYDGPTMGADTGGGRPMTAQEQSPGNLDVNAPLEQRAQNVMTNTGIAQNIDAGVQNSLTGLVAKKVLNIAGVDLPAAYPNAHPGLLSLSTVIQAADPLAIGIFKTAETPLTSLLGVSKTAPEIALSANGARMGVAADNAAQSVTQGIKDFAQKWIAQPAMNGGVGFARYGVTKDLLESDNGDGKDKSLALLSDIPKNFAQGAVLAPPLHAAGLGILKAADMLFGVGDAIDAGSNTVSLKANSAAADVARMSAVREAALDAHYTTQVRLANGVISSDELPSEFAKLFQDNLRQRNLLPGNISAMPGTLIKAFANPETVFSKIDKELGTNTSGIHDALFEAQNKQASIANTIQGNVKPSLDAIDKLTPQFEPIRAHMGAIYGRDFSNREAAGWLLQYMEDTPDGDIKFNPESAFNVRERWVGPTPSPEIIDALKPLRAEMSRTMVNDPDYAEYANYRTGYVPAMQLDGEATKPLNTNSVSNPSFLQQRVTGQLDPFTHELDVGVLMNKWANSYSRFAAFRGILQDAGNQWMMLHALDKDASQYFLSNLKNAFNLRDSNEAAALFGKHFIAANSNFIDQIAAKTAQPDSFTSELVQFARNQFYNRSVFENPLVWIKHLIQPEFVAGAEMGNGAVARGTKALLFDKDMQQLAEEMLPRLKKADISNDIVGNTPEFDRKGLDNLNKVMSVTSKPGKWVLNTTDTFNRKRVFLGGYLQAKDAIAQGGDSLLKLTANMNPGQRLAVMDTLKEQGPEAAARKYGQVRSYRSQWAYGILNKPKAFQGDLAQYMPFTSWSSNELSNVVGDVQAGNWGTLAKKAAIPMLGMYALKMLTGYQIPNLHPFSAIGEALQPGSNPWLTPAVNMAKPILNGQMPDATAAKKTIQSMLAPLTPYATADKYLKSSAKSGGDPLQDLLRLKRAKTSKY